MTKNVSVPLVCALASMAGNKHPIPIAIVDRPRIAFNIFYSLQGREFARKKDPDVVCEGSSAEARSALCTAIGEARKGKVTRSRADAEKCRPRRPPASSRNAFAKGKRKIAQLSPDDFIFENEDGGFLDTDNYRKRVLHKIARELHLPKLTFQVIRRTIATIAQKKGTVKDVQGVMRHSRTATTTDIYMQEIPASVQSTINSINL
jgi:hypothetical protein